MPAPMKARPRPPRTLSSVIPPRLTRTAPEVPTIGDVVPVPVVDFHSVVSLVDRFPVLAGIDFRVDAGEIVLISGNNGAGKTSLLRALAGLTPICRGKATVLGLDLRRDRRELRRRVGLLAHRASLYAELSVAENVSFAVRAAGGDVSRVTGVLEQLGLSRRLSDVAVDRLSAGQRRRTALAVLVARDPELWLLDEPHTGFDAGARVLLDEIITGASRRGHTVVFTSHETEHAVTIASRHVVIAGGVVAPSSTVDVVEPEREPTHVA